jgi:hypothetical protein
LEGLTRHIKAGPNKKQRTTTIVFEGEALTGLRGAIFLDKDQATKSLLLVSRLFVKNTQTFDTKMKIIAALLLTLCAVING